MEDQNIISKYRHSATHVDPRHPVRFNLVDRNIKFLAGGIIVGSGEEWIKQIFFYAFKLGTKSLNMIGFKYAKDKSAEVWMPYVLQKESIEIPRIKDIESKEIIFNSTGRRKIKSGYTISWIP